MIPMSDVFVENVYDIVNRQDGEHDRLAVARAARLAAEYRAMQLQRDRMQRAIEKRTAERQALRRDTQQRAALTSAIGAVASETMPAEWAGALRDSDAAPAD